VEPLGQITDSKTEDYDFRATLPSAPSTTSNSGSTDHVIVVRVWDRYENMAAAKTVIRGK